MNVAEIIPLADTWGMHGDVGWGWGSLMMAVMVLFWGAVIFGIVWLIRSVAGGGPAPSGETPVSRETAVQIHDHRERHRVLANGIGGMPREAGLKTRSGTRVIHSAGEAKVVPKTVPSKEEQKENWTPETERGYGGSDELELPTLRAMVRTGSPVLRRRAPGAAR